MSNKAKGILIIIILVMFLGVTATVSILSKHVPKNPDGINGNTPGNLFSGGLFCEDDEYVYFANAYDNYTLYRMRPDETEVEKLSNSVSSSLNEAGDYIYYYQADSNGTTGYGSMFRINGLYRVKKDGKKTTCLKRCFVPALALSGNTLFYQLYDTKLGTNFYRIDINKKNDLQIGDGRIDPCGLVGETIYYGGFDAEHNLHTIDVNSNADTVTMQGEFYLPQVIDDFVYYMDIHKNYRLYRRGLGSSESTCIVNERIDSFNVYGGVIYYQTTGSNGALWRVNVDGSNPEKIIDGAYEHITITSNYVYFNQFDTPTPVFHQPTYGPVMPGTFTIPAEEKSFFKDLFLSIKNILPF